MALDVVEPGTNIVHKPNHRDSSIVWLDHEERDPQRRFKLFCISMIMKEDGRNHAQLSLFCSPDGIHWGQPVKSSPAHTSLGDRSTVFYNPFRKVWVYSLRVGYRGVGRARLYREHPDPLAGLDWENKDLWLRTKDLYLWTNADRLDPHNPNPALAKVSPELYNLDAVAYESLILGLFSIWQGDPREAGQKRNEVLLGFSRDGFHWHRPDRTPFIGVQETPGAWNWANVQSAGGGCLVVGDKLYFYVSGRQRDAKAGRDSTGLAVLRRDGFASLDAGNQEGTLMTRPVRFGGKRLFVNVDARQGQLQAEVVDRQDKVIEPFTKDNCTPIRADRTQIEVRWNGATDLSALSGKPVKFRFTVRNGSLYSWWVSPDASGASHGYVAAGGPGLTGPTDTVGPQRD